MTFHRIHATTTLTVSNRATMLQVWRNYGPVAQTLIGAVIVEKPLTPAQIRALPEALKTKLQVKANLERGATSLDRLHDPGTPA